MRSTSGLVLVSLLTLILSGCVSTNVNECVWVKPITWHQNDTEQTKREIFAHNLKWETFCSD